MRRSLVLVIVAGYRLDQNHISYVQTCNGNIDLTSYGSVGGGQGTFLLKVDVFIGSPAMHQLWEPHLLNNQNGVTAINLGGGSATVTNYGTIQ
jgi:hypothetical protein